MATARATRIPIPAHGLGLAGVVPFAALAIGAIVGPDSVRPMALQYLATYGAVILAFMGGVQWGLEMQRPGAGGAPSWGRLGISVLPALAAWTGLALLSSQAVTGLLAGCFALWLVYDLSTVRRGLAPAWYAAMRLQLTAAVVICLVTPLLVQA